MTSARLPLYARLAGAYLAHQPDYGRTRDALYALRDRPVWRRIAVMVWALAGLKERRAT